MFRTLDFGGLLISKKMASCLTQQETAAAAAAERHSNAGVMPAERELLQAYPTLTAFLKRGQYFREIGGQTNCSND